jgi:hypothetical protein
MFSKWSAIFSTSRREQPSRFRLGTIFEKRIWRKPTMKGVCSDHDPHLRVEADALPDLFHQQAVAHQDRGLDDELLALLQLGRGHLAVEILQREHAEGDVTGLVAHHVGGDLLDQRLVRLGEFIPKAARARPSTMICMPR